MDFYVKRDAIHDYFLYSAHSVALVDVKLVGEEGKNRNEVKFKQMKFFIISSARLRLKLLAHEIRELKLASLIYKAVSSHHPCHDTRTDQFKADGNTNRAVQ